MKGIIFNVMLPWVQLSPPDNATSSSVCVTVQLFPLLGIYLREGKVDFKVFWNYGRVCSLKFWVQQSHEISVLVAGFVFWPMTGKCRLLIINWHVSIEFYECMCWLTESCDRRRMSQDRMTEEI